MAGCLTSCDIGTTFLVDGNPEFRLTKSCGDITMTGVAFEPDQIKVEFDGDFKVCPDSIKVRKRGVPTPDSEIMFTLDGVELKDRSPVLIDGKGVFQINIRQYPSLNYGRTGTIELLPSDFILCDGKPVITDTIRFACKPRKQRKK